jgi:O-antigen/teichoic acid export membrane protein
MTSWLRSHAQLNLALSDQAMVSGANFAMNLLLARHLGIEEFGRFVLAWMTVLIAASLQEGLIIAPMMSIGPTVPAAERGRYFTTVLCHQTFCAGAAFALLVVGVAASGSAVPSWHIDDLALPLATAAAAHLLQEFVRRYLYTRGAAPAALCIDAVYYLGRLAAVLCLFRLGPVTTSMMLWTIAAAACLSFAAGILQFGRLQFSSANLKSVTARHWRFARWLGASAIMFWACNSFFIFSAGVLLGAWAVGAIKAAQDVMGVTNILYQGIYNVVIVGAAKQLHSGGAVALRTYLRQVAVFGGIAIGAIGLVASTSPSTWLRLFYGEQYSGYGHLVQWYALAYLIGFLHVPLRVGLYVAESTKAVFAGYAAVAVFSLASAYPLIRTFGINGAMGGPVAAEVIMCVILYILLRRRLSPAPTRPAEHPKRLFRTVRPLQ